MYQSGFLFHYLYDFQYINIFTFRSGSNIYLFLFLLLTVYSPKLLRLTTLLIVQM